MEIKLVHLSIGNNVFIDTEVLEVRETPINFITTSGNRVPKSKIMLPRLTIEDVSFIYCSVFCYSDDEDVAIKLVKKEVGDYIKKIRVSIEKLDMLFSKTFGDNKE